jgi:uncharacterized iron-regulated protein
MARLGWSLALLACACTPSLPPMAPPASLLRVRAGTEEVGFEAFAERVAAADLVCIGEQHDDPDHHVFQRDLTQGLADASAADGRRLAIGMEMFRRGHQASLDAFGRREIGAAELAAASDWEHSWGFDFAMYRPLLDVAQAHHAPVIGLNAPRELTRAVARRGLDTLPPAVRASLPELDLRDEGHRAFFWAVMGFAEGEGGHGGGAQSHERFYTAQVIWDETMAESAAAWLDANEPRRIAVIAGNGHCHTSAIPARVERRVKKDALSVLVVSDVKDLPPHAKSDFVVELR